MLEKEFENATIILASGSPRRKRVFDSCELNKFLQTAEMRYFFVKFLKKICCMCCMALCYVV